MQCYACMQGPQGIASMCIFMFDKHNCLYVRMCECLYVCIHMHACISIRMYECIMRADAPCDTCFETHLYKIIINAVMHAFLYAIHAIRHVFYVHAYVFLSHVGGMHSLYHRLYEYVRLDRQAGRHIHAIEGMKLSKISETKSIIRRT